MKKVDLKKQLAAYYKQRRAVISELNVPAFNFLMIDGKGNPNTSQAYAQAIEVLYSLSYTLKFMLKMDKKLYDYPVMGLEGLWWAKDMGAFRLGDKDSWEWTAMILQPDFITQEMYREAASQVKQKKILAALGRERLERFEEGLCVQTLHIGPYDKEGPTIEAVHRYIHDHGFELRGKHHEIYFGDPRRSNPQNLKTIIRQPIQET